MKKQKIANIIVPILCLCASVAKAQYDWVLPEGAGPTFRMGVGPSFFQNGTLREFTLEGTPPFSAQNQRVSYDTGIAVGGALGYAFDKYFSLDFESGYIWAQLDNVPGYIVHDSSIGNVPLLVNAKLTLPIPHTNIVPYVGGGVGGAVSVFDARGFSDAGQNVIVDGSDSEAVFACQAFAGVRFLLARNLSLGVGYNFFATGNPTFSYPAANPAEPNLDIGFRGVRTHSVMFTLEWNF